MPYKPVDTAIRVILGPAIDDTDFKAREEAIAYNQAGMEVDIILEKHDGTIVTTAVTPTSAGVYDWVHTDQGYYSLELPASGGGTFNNTEEGIITAVAYCTGVLPFRSISYDVVPALVYASMVKGTDALQVDAIQISGDATAANNAELAFDGTGYGFTGCTMPTVTTLTGHTAQTGDNFARIGATGSALTSLAQASVCTDARLAELAAANIPSDIDDLLTRLSAARAGYLDNLSAGAVAQAATALLNTTWTDAKAGYLNHSIATIDTNVDDLLTRITAARAGYLDELAAANLPSDIDDLLTRLSAARAGYLDNLSAGAVALANEYDQDFEDLRVLVGDGGNVFYVSKSGDNSDGTTWAKAMTTLDAAIALCTANNSDKIYVANGTYDETANGGTGVAVDVEGIKIVGVGLPTIKNTDTTANGKVFTVTATNTIIENIYTTKGETASDGAICILVNGAYVTCDIRGVMISTEKTTHTGVKFDGGAIACSYIDTDDHLAHIYSLAGDGVGIEFADCSGCIVVAPSIHDLTTAIYFSGGADCEFNVLSPGTMILNCDTAITLDAGAHSNALSASIVNCTTEYNDNSGNNTNKADASVTYVLDDIKTHIQTGVNEIQGAGFIEATDSLEAIRNRGDAAWITGAGGTVPSLLQNTTIATLASQTSFTLTAGSADDDAYNNAIIVITDSVTAEQKAVGWVSNYVGATKTITLTTDPAIFTMAVGDIVDIIATDYAIANIWGTVSSIFTQVGIDGAGLTNMPWNGSWDAEVQSEVNDALVAFFTSADELVDNIWDEVLTGATHNVSTSAGRRVRELGAYHITSGTAQGGTAYSITLAAADTAADHIYNRNLLVILAGTGTGQTRTIVDYDGTSKIAVVDRDWWINPDATSEYTIIPDDTPLVADHGVATAGTNNTITLRSDASAIDSTYSDIIIFIMAGTGAGQAKLIDTYVGGTKVATIHGTWTTNPDNTSVYCMIASGLGHTVDIDPVALALVKTQADNALSDVNLDHLMQLALTVNDGAPNAADFITSSAIAIDDWYNQNMLLFTSGALAGLARFIDDYGGATKRIYLAEAFPQAPANTDAFVIVGVSGSAPAASTVADAVWDELEAGHTVAGSFGEEVTKQGKKLDRNLILDL